MPIIKSAQKKLRKDVKRTVANRSIKTTLKKALKESTTHPTPENVSLAYKAADKAAKRHLIHKNKAARIKSAISKLLGTKSK